MSIVFELHHFLDGGSNEIATYFPRESLLLQHIKGKSTYQYNIYVFKLKEHRSGQSVDSWTVGQ